MSEEEDIAVRLARLEERVGSIAMSTALAKTDVDRRLTEMNELRRQIEDERGDYLLAARYDERHEDLVRRIDALGKQVNANSARLSGIEGGTQLKSSAIAWGLAGLGIFVTIVVVVVNVLTSGTP